MPDVNFILLYVDSPAASAAFYENLLDGPPVENSPTFAMFAMKSGIMLGLWKRDGVEPAAQPGTFGGELAFAVESAAAVSALHAEWSAKALTIAQQPTRMDFGFTFTALDPDGHRLRVFAPG